MPDVICQYRSTFKILIASFNSSYTDSRNVLATLRTTKADIGNIIISRIMIIAIAVDLPDPRPPFKTILRYLPDFASFQICLNFAMNTVDSLIDVIDNRYSD